MKGLFEIGDKLLHARPRLRREVLFDIQLTQGFADGAVHIADGALPLGFLLGGAAQQLAVKGEVGLVESRAQIGRIGIEQLQLQIILPLNHRCLRDDFVKRSDEIRLAHHIVRLSADIQISEKSVPRRCQGVQQGVATERIVGFLRITVGHPGPVVFGEAGLEVDGCGHHFGGILAVAAQFEQAQQVAAVTVSQLLALLAAVEVVVAVGHAESSLGQVHGIARRVLAILADTDRERRGDAAPRQVREQGGELIMALQCSDGCHVIGEGVQPCFGRTVGIEKVLIKRADEFLVVALRVFLNGLDDVLELMERPLAQHIEAAPGGLVGGDFRVAQPGAVDVQKEIVLRANGGVHALAFNARQRHACRRAGLIGSTGAENCHEAQRAQKQGGDFH